MLASYQKITFLNENVPFGEVILREVFDFVVWAEAVEEL